MRILFLGDVVGKAGIRAVQMHLHRLVSRERVSFVVANCENVAGGAGVDAKGVGQLLDAGVDVLTSGNHIWNRSEARQLVEEEERLLRPANYPDSAPGCGFRIFDSNDGVSVGVLNVMGRIFMDPVDCPFQVADRVLGSLNSRIPLLVDVHAEATSEKAALGWYLAGRVSAVLGSHTHVQTADERILPGDTAYISDAGMCGSFDSIIGMVPDAVVERFVRRMPTKLTPARANPVLQGALVDVDPANGTAVAIERVRENAAG